MSETNKSYRIRTTIGANEDSYISLDAKLLQDYNTFDILSLKISSTDAYRLHNSNYGIIVGRVLANNGFGVPNAKLSVFIPYDGEDEELSKIYPYTSPASRDDDGVRYNLLPDSKISDCHQVVGTFPTKRYMLDNNDMIEVFDKYYKYTTRTNNSGDYLICGVPVGSHTLHMDLDLSDCGILSQKPRDFVYKGYTIEQFENPNKFKSGTEYGSLSQIFTQDQVVNVTPLWGNESLGETLGLTRADINISFKFEPTCIFMGCVASDNSSQGISQKCIPTPHMGDMDELVSGEGTIEMIRKTPGGSVEEFQIKGTQLINENGVWCYQIPMNLDYMMTDEYGNMVPTDNPDIGIPTRARVRFRISMQDNEENTDNFFRAKALVPHNPQITEGYGFEDYDYEFGTLTKETSYRDLFWNNVYTVKSFIPRFQKRKVSGWKEDKFTGIKQCNHYGANNPIPYNNMRIKLPFMFIVMCILIKIFIKVVSIINTLISMFGNFLADIGDTHVGWPDLWIFGWNICWWPFSNLYDAARKLKMNIIEQGMCPDLENWYFSPMIDKGETLWEPDKQAPNNGEKYNLLRQTLNSITREMGGDGIPNPNTTDDYTSVDYQNASMNAEGGDNDNDAICVTVKTDYLISCIEMNLAQEYKVIKFDFYNDWINGLIYFPRWMRYIRPKVTFLGITLAMAKVRGCMDDTSIFSKARKYTQQCVMPLNSTQISDSIMFNRVAAPSILSPYSNETKAGATTNKMHKKSGFTQKAIFGSNGGICHEQTTSKKQYVYYLKPCEWVNGDGIANRKVTLFATDLVLLGSLNDCDPNGVPQAFKYLTSTTYIMPTNLALTNMETNGPLYGKEGGTICAGYSNQTSLDDTNNKGVSQVNISEQGLTSELDYYNAAGGRSSYDVNYEKDELSDTIALTEAAGISWNWTGPGQGSIKKNLMMYPGGHFLGLSCLNSETNIKSCLNLSRICEIGVAMSQRKEDVRGVKDGKLLYAYTVPSGFISGDEIVDTNFRTMFATMNHKRLLATKTNPDTGYKIYDFDYLRPNGFGGEFKNVLAAANNNRDVYNAYNRKITTVDESYKLINFGVGSATTRDDYDSEETNFTQFRTIENESLDYYLFRMGMQYSDASVANKAFHMRRFLIGNGSQVALPQYENSYYFYFGMKYGATALDEFNKTFFSKCESGKITSGVITLNVGYEVKICEGVGTIVVETENMEFPCEWSVKGELFNVNETGKTEESSFKVSDLKVDKYTIKIKDANGMETKKVIDMTNGLFSFNSNSYNFNVHVNEVSSSRSKNDGGFIEISDVYINGKAVSPSEYKLSLNYKSGDEIKEESNCSEENGILYAKSADTKYYVLIKYKSSGCSGLTAKLIDFTPSDNSSIKLMIGNDQCNMEINSGVTSEWWMKNGKVNLGENEGLKWFYKTAFFKQNSKGTSHAASIFAKNGSLVLWGTPQEKDKGFNSGTTAWSNDISIASGYSVSINNFYYPTYGISEKDNIKQNCVIAYNGNNIWGKKYCGTVSGGKVSTIDKTFAIGMGAVYKDISNETKIFGISKKKGDNIEEVTDGIIYQPFTFPIFDRDFYVNANFLEQTKYLIQKIQDENGGSTYESYNTNMRGISEYEIHNGITYNKKFSKSSLLYPNITDIKVELDDTYGIGEKKSEDRITTIKKVESVTATNTPYTYRLTSGYPDDVDNAETLATTINGSISSEFYSSILYTRDDNRFSFTFKGESSSDAVYYFCRKNDPGIINKSGYITLKESFEELVLCQYTSAATYNNEGETVIAYYRELNGEFYCRYTVKDKTGIDSVDTISKFTDVLPTGLSQQFANFAPKITPIPQYELNSAVTINGDSISLISAITRDFGGIFMDENRKIKNSGFTSSDDDEFYVVGIINQKNGSGVNRIMHFYPYMPQILDDSSTFDVRITITPSIILYKEKCAAQLSLLFNTAKEWKASPSDNSGITLSSYWGSATTVALTIDESLKGNHKITFKYKDGTGKQSILPIKQYIEENVDCTAHVSPYCQYKGKDTIKIAEFYITNKDEYYLSKSTGFKICIGSGGFFSGTLNVSVIVKDSEGNVINVCYKEFWGISDAGSAQGHEIYSLDCNDMLFTTNKDKEKITIEYVINPGTFQEWSIVNFNPNAITIKKVEK